MQDLHWRFRAYWHIFRWVVSSFCDDRRWGCNCWQLQGKATWFEKVPRDSALAHGDISTLKNAANGWSMLNADQRHEWASRKKWQATASLAILYATTFVTSISRFALSVNSKNVDRASRISRCYYMSYGWLHVLFCFDRHVSGGTVFDPFSIA